MIIVRIGAVGVERIELQPSDNVDEDMGCLASWPEVRASLNRLDRKLRRDARMVLDKLEHQAEPAKAA
jgi:hypothetical protein